MSTVKGSRRRSYDSSGRQAQARRSQDAVLDAAERQFRQAGYAATTLATIAAEADVSVELIYKSMGGKSGVVRAIYDRALGGRQAVPAYARSDAMRERESDPRTIMRKWSELGSEVAAQVTPIRLIIRAAATSDPEIAALLKAEDDERLERMRHHAEFLAERGYLRSGVTTDKATDVMYTCTSLEIYEVLVLQRGWSLPEFAQFTAEFMISALLA
jgi:AcrR family transcriptional regulator